MPCPGLRAVLAALLLVAPARAAALADPGLRRLENSLGGRVGVAVLDAAGQPLLLHRADQRFPMCSTFKAPLAAAILAGVDAGRWGLDRRLAFAEKDLLAHAPVTRARVAEGALSVGDLVAATVEESDNTAANLLVDLLGGPSRLTAFLRGIGDRASRLDRKEPELNQNGPGDPRDTTTPRAMASTLRALLTGPALSEASRARFRDHLLACRTGGARLRAGLPPGWRLAHKTGSGNRGATHDVGMLLPPSGPPVYIAVYLSGSPRPQAELEAAIAGIARRIAQGLPAGDRR